MEMYVLQIKPGFEMSAYKILLSLGYDAVLPVKQEFIRHGGQWNIYEKIVFSQYLFIRCDLNNKKNYYKIKSVDGVVRVLGNEEGRRFQSLKPSEKQYIEWLWNKGKPIEPSKIYVTSNGDKMIMSGILREYKDNEIRYNLRQRKASVVVTVAGEKHMVTLPVICI